MADRIWPQCSWIRSSAEPEVVEGLLHEIISRGENMGKRVEET